MLNFEPITLERSGEYLERLAQCPQQTSDYSFANLWGWAEEYGLEWAFGDTCAWVRQTLPTVRYWAPVGPWDNLDWNKCPTLASGTIPELIRVPAAFCTILGELLGDRAEVIEDRGNWDYVYKVDDLIHLRGNKLHGKKNHLNQFKKKFDFEYRPLTPDCMEETIEMQDLWCHWRECEDSPALVAENGAVTRVLQDWDRLPNLIGGALHVDGKMIAYTVAEPLTDDTLVIHFEKGKPGYRGVYQAINQMFLENAADGFTYVNREQDLDDEGLRKAKLSYQPDHFSEKCRVVIK